MDRLSLAELDGLGDVVEDLVGRTPGADPWCSTLDWVLPAHRAFAPEAEPLVLHASQTLALLARYTSDEGIPVVAGLEPLWGFAHPLLGPDPARSARHLAAALAADASWGLVLVSGLPAEAAAVRAVALPLAALGPVRLAEGIVRQVADLGGGLDAYWARRSSRFRRNLGRARRQARAAGLEVLDVSDQPDLHQRLVRIEARSWKGRSGEGLASPAMAAFYRFQLDRLRRQGRIRAQVARLDGRDVGFIVGGRRGRHYRGLQLSFVEEVRSLSVGHLLQDAELTRLAAEGVATYDLGMDLDYKRSWADHPVASVALVVERGSAGRGRLR